MEKLFKRQIEDKIVKFHKNKQAIVIVGSRQVGKTSLLKRLRENYFQNEINLYFDLEFLDNLKIFNRDIKEIENFIRSKGIDLSVARINLYLDEIQLLDDPAKFIKLAVDHFHDKIKLYITGSTSMYVEKFKDSLTGRKILFELFPLSFKEFLEFKGEKDLLANLPDWDFQKGISGMDDFYFERLRNIYLDFLVFGGYPAIVLEEEHEKKIRLLNEIVSSYILKDIRGIFQINNINGFNNLVRYLSINSGKLFNLNSTSNYLGINRHTLKRYIDILENTFIIKRIGPFYRNKSTEIVKSKKVYFTDTGIRNSLVNNFNLTYERDDIGILFENGVFSQLNKSTGIDYLLKFYRTQTGSEIDFILEGKEGIVPVEVKLTMKSTRALKEFMKKYGIEVSYVCTAQGFKKEKGVNFIPAWILG